MLIVGLVNCTILNLKPLKQHFNFDLSPVDNKRLANLCGQFNEHIRHLERHLGVEIHNRGHSFQVSGNDASVTSASKIINHLYKETQSGEHLTAEKIHMLLKASESEQTQDDGLSIHTKYCTIKPNGANQQKYIKNIQSHDINFGIGPAGTGKTYLSVACAIAALEKARVRRILLVRPAVEAGERLGFLPGDYTQKVDPYFRPLYDALYEMLGFDRVSKLLERHIIEVVPLAYMRGRTLNDSFIILDEGQNTTREQMKMFLTRIGFNSIAVITGDTTQIDLPKGTQSGLTHAIEVLKDVKGISLMTFESKDVVRHALVQAIIDAYEKQEQPSRDR